MKRMRPLMLLFLFSLAACEPLAYLTQLFGEEPVPAPAPVAPAPQVVLAVRAVEVDRTYLPLQGQLPTGYEYVEDQLPAKPADLLAALGERMFRAGGGEFNARLHIAEASIVKVPLPQEHKIIGWYHQARPYRYDLRYDVDVEILDARGYIVASTNSVVVRTKEMEEGATAAQRLMALQAMDEDAQAAMEKELPKAVHNYLDLFILKPAGENSGKN